MFDIDRMAELPSIEPLPAGWMNEFDLQVLYNVALQARPPFLEIGPWIGRSTSAICAGIRDSGIPKTFDLVDFGICGVEDYKERFGYVPDFEHPDHVRGELGPSITAPGGTLAVLIENLRLNGMLKFTTSICRGDWIECPHGRKYGFVFIDAVHNENEARRHVPKLKEFLLPHAIVVVDDVNEQDFARRICALLGAKEFTLTASLGRSGKLMVSEIP
jgi:Methyltransferase domain